MDDAVDEPYADVPVMLSVRDRRCVVVGGGGVGARRARTLSEAGAKVVMIALQVHPSARLAGVRIEERAFQPEDLDGALLVVVATDVEEINDAVSEAAAERGVLVNRADRSEAGGLTFMTAHRDGPLTVAVHTGGASASAATRIRALLVADLDPAWGRLLASALPVRRAIQERVRDPAKRVAMLRRLSDDRALKTLRDGGESALKGLYADIMKDLA
ncbi:MAG: precorrin-2 dehydrogenase/sirohydrochlorin ferrochelatase family protein [Phycisphaeraceae bacterium]